MSIQIFKNSEFGEVRVSGTSERPLFCLADVCRALDIKNASGCKARLKQDGIGTAEVIDSIGRIQVAIFITESNLYKCIFQSRRPDAEKFQDWIFEEVLPSIRKHGAYLTPAKIEEALNDPDTIIQLATNLKNERAKRLEAESIIEQNAPRVLFSKSVETSNRSCLVAELAKILNQNGINIGQNRLFDWMRKNGYLCTKGDYYNQPTQRSMDMGLFDVKKTVINCNGGSVLVSNTTKVTGKGQVYFVNKFLCK